MATFAPQIPQESDVREHRDEPAAPSSSLPSGDGQNAPTNDVAVTAKSQSPLDKVDGTTHSAVVSHVNGLDSNHSPSLAMENGVISPPAPVPQVSAESLKALDQKIDNVDAASTAAAILPPAVKAPSPPHSVVAEAGSNPGTPQGNLVPSSESMQTANLAAAVPATDAAIHPIIGAGADEQVALNAQNDPSNTQTPIADTSTPAQEMPASETAPETAPSSDAATALAAASEDDTKMDIDEVAPVKISREREEDDEEMTDEPAAKRLRVEPESSDPPIATSSGAITNGDAMSTALPASSQMSAVEPTVGSADAADVPAASATATAPSTHPPVTTPAAPAASATAPVAPPAPPPAITGDFGPLTDVASKRLLDGLRNLKKSKNAIAFQKPVDPVLLNIPTYFDIVKTPMDLSQMERKLKSAEYTSVNEYVDDFNLMVANAIRFNGSQHPVAQAAMSLQSAVQAQLKKLPAPGAVPAPAKGKLSRPSLPSQSSPTPAKPAAAAAAPAQQASPVAAAASPPARAPAPAPAAVATPTPAPIPPVNTAPPPAPPVSEKKTRRESRPSVGSAQSPTNTFAAPNGIPTIRRDSTAGNRPKREIHKPPPRDLPYAGAKPRKKKFQAELQFCGEVITELKRPRYAQYLAIFAEPVDPVALNIPTYRKVIKNPMDISTITTKYENNQYQNAKEFEKDWHLMFNNCYKFNGPDHPVSKTAKDYEHYFTEEMSKKDSWIATHAPASSGAQSPAAESEEEEEEEDSEDEEEAARNAQLAQMHAQIAALQAQTASLMSAASVKKEKKPKKDKKAAKTGKPGKKSGAGGGGAGKEKKARGGKASRPRGITTKDKEEIVAKIGELDGNGMSRAAELIKASFRRAGMQEQADKPDDDLEFDIDQIPEDGLQGLLKLVREVVPSAVPSRETAASARRYDGGGGGGNSKQKKSKPMSGREQAEAVNRLDQQIAGFDSGAGDTSDMKNESSDEEDDEDTGSESEEE